MAETVGSRYKAKGQELHEASNLYLCSGQCLRNMTLLKIYIIFYGSQRRRERQRQKHQ